jgi:hypothetical protein
MNGKSLNGKPSFWALVGGLALVFLSGVLIVFLVWRKEGIKDYDQLRSEQRAKNLVDLNAENQKTLSSYHWVDRPKGVVAIPIDRAMQLVMVDLRSNQPHAAGPVTTPAPSPAPTPTNAAPQSTPATPNQAAPAAPKPANSPAASPAPIASPAPRS